MTKWINSYWTNRVQYVLIDGVKSKIIKVFSGVPQGSHLGPLIFNLFINDITAVINYSKCLLYADDLKLYLPINGPNDVLELQYDIDAVCTWCLKNQLALNVKKCKVMSYYRIAQPIFALYVINEERISEIKDLGVIFTISMSFNRHIDTIIAKALSMLGFIRRVSRNFRNPSIFFRLYCAYVRSQLEYASVVWCPYYDVHIKRIENVQKKFLISFAYITGQLPSDPNMAFWEKVMSMPPYHDQCKDLCVNSLERRRQFAGALFVSDLLMGVIDSSVLLQSINICIPRISSRKHEFLYNDRHRTNYGSNGPVSSMSKHFNLFSDIFDFDTRSEFKKRLNAL